MAVDVQLAVTARALHPHAKAAGTNTMTSFPPQTMRSAERPPVSSAGCNGDGTVPFAARGRSVPARGVVAPGGQRGRVRGRQLLVAGPRRRPPDRCCLTFPPAPGTLPSSRRACALVRMPPVAPLPRQVGHRPTDADIVRFSAYWMSLIGSTQHALHTAWRCCQMLRPAQMHCSGLGQQKDAT